MILRRVIEHVKAENWTAIVLDFVIVVTGVFIGMQVTNWNEARAAKARGREFSERLLNEVRLEAHSYKNQISYYREVRANADKAIAAMEGERPLTDEQLLVSAYRATQYLYIIRHRAAFDELVSTGAIGLVADQNLRETAIPLYTTTVTDDIREEAMKSEYRTAFRRAVPAAVQQELLQKCGDRGSDRARWTLDYPCTLDLPPAETARAANALRNEPLALPALRQRFADLETAVFNLETGKGETRAGLRHFAGDAP